MDSSNGRGSSNDTESDPEFLRLLAQLSAPTSDAGPAVPPTLPRASATDTPLIETPAPRPAPPPSTPASVLLTPTSVSSPPLPLDVSALLSAQTAHGADPWASAVPLVPRAVGSDVEDADIARSTTGERIALILAVLLPPLGFIASLIGAVISVQRRGWVVGVLRAGIVLGIVFSLVVGVVGYVAYTRYEQQRQHDETAAAGAAFCAMIAADPTMIRPPTFGWPSRAGSIPDSLAAMQAFDDRWVALAKVSPSEIKADVTKIHTAAKKIIDSVAVARTVNDASNVAVMTSVASASRVPAWHAEYCS